MGCRNTYCIGGGCEPTSTDVKAWVAAFGYVYDANDPLESYYKEVIATYPESKNGPVWSALAEACMRTRAILFCNSTPGDVGGLKNGSTATNIPGIGAIAFQGAQVGESIATAAGAVLGALGPITAGVGSILGPILQLFQAHAKAVAAQANALNSLTPLATQSIRQCDAAVQNGSATPEQGVTFLHSLAQTISQQDAGLTKSCNAFCGYNAIVNAMADVSVYFYQLSAAAQAQSVELTSNITQTPTNITSGTLTPSAALAAVTPAAPSVFSTIPAIVWIIIAIAVIFFAMRGA